MSGADDIEKLLRTMRIPANQNTSFFQAIWGTRNRELWTKNSRIYEVFAARVLEFGEPLLAFDVVSEGLESSPDNVPLRRLLALAMARSGAARQANRVLTVLYQQGHRDEESIGLLARTHKNLAAEADSDVERKHHLRKAFRYYFGAYRTSGGFWTGINAATLACLLNDENRAVALAEEVRKECLEKLRASATEVAGQRYWLLSTLGEAALLQQQWEVAIRWYEQAVALCGNDWGKLQSTRHNARLLVEHFERDFSGLDSVFKAPTVIVFSGHLVDRRDRAVSRLTAQLVPEVKNEIRRRLQSLNARIGYASAACGSDILFHEVMLELGGEIHVVLPYERTSFIKNSVDSTSRGEWSKRFAEVIKRANELQELSCRAEDGREPVSLQFANRMLLGLAKLRAQQLETRLIPLAVWDGKPGDGPGGTADNVEIWRRSGLDVQLIEPRALSKDVVAVRSAKLRKPVARVRSSTDGNNSFTLEIRALLFADFQGFSRLTDYEVPRFVTHCLGLVGDLIAHSLYKPIVKNTWGDGLYMVFASMRDAGCFALELRDRVREMRWSEKGLPELKVRIGLHAGPVLSCTDPVTDRKTYFGAHVSRAARIEPITPAGQVYASQVYAALAASEGVTNFQCNYVGQTPLAKHYGTYPTYVVTPLGAAASAH
jgi:class 3 adenylate cyclase/tetratricopeptide (TPR) repeat protein